MYLNKLYKIGLFFLLFGCEKNHLPHENFGKNIVHIDTIKTGEIYFDNICFQIQDSRYPQIKGLGNQIFEKQINEIFQVNFNEFIDSAKKHYSGCYTTEELKDSPLLSIPQSVGCDFEVLTNNDSIISIVQYFVEFPQGGGNGYSISSKVLTFNHKTQNVKNSSLIGIKYVSLKTLNLKVHNYFHNLFHKEYNKINYPNIETYEACNFGIRNDSVLLVIDAFPTSHASYQTYLIPLEKCKK